MQQSFKLDVVKRFYVYHTLNTGMQLENLPKKEVIDKSGKKIEIKSYDGILPVYTLIWMADDSLNFDVETITYALSPQQTVEFIKDNALWESKNIEKICAIREEILTLLNNEHKDLGFLYENKLVYAFQRNIVKSSKFQKYKEWFEFAETTRNRKNTKKDFEKFKNNKTLMAVLDRIKKDTLNEDEMNVFHDWENAFADLAEREDDLNSGRYAERVIEEKVRKALLGVRQEVRQEVRDRKSVV